MDTVLIVDDEADIRDMLGQWLETEGFVTVQAENGLEALATLKSRPLPQFILLDLGMPVMNGVEFRRRQRLDPRLAGIPVIAMSAGSIGRMAAYSLGVAAYVEKPISLEKLTSLIHSRGIFART